MKTVKDIQQKAFHFLDGISQEELTELGAPPVPTYKPTFRQLMLNLLGGSKAKDAEESVDMFQALLKIRSALTEVELDDSEFKLVLRKTNENVLGWPVIWQGQLLEFLQQFDRKEAQNGQ